jgi:hypothetical protein
MYEGLSLFGISRYKSGQEIYLVLYFWKLDDIDLDSLAA